MSEAAERQRPGEFDKDRAKMLQKLKLEHFGQIPSANFDVVCREVRGLLTSREDARAARAAAQAGGAR